jgi:predicted Zn-dependent peptidase
LVKEQKLFNSLSASLTGSIETGLLVIQGKLNAGVSLAEADAAVESILSELREQPVDEQELNKVKNQAEASLVFSEIELLNRAMNLAYSKLLGNANFVNEEGALIQAVTPQDILASARKVLHPTNCSTLYYEAKPQEVVSEQLQEEENH